jgi:hypothetical protein
MAKDKPAVVAQIPGSKSKEEFFKDLAEFGDVTETVDLAESTARYSPGKCNGDTVLGYLYAKRHYRGGAPDAQGEKHGWTGYTVRLAKPCTGLLGNSQNERTVEVGVGEDIIIGGNAVIEEKLDQLFEESKTTVPFIALAPSHQEKAKVGQKWVFHFRAIPTKDQTREAVGLPEWKPFAKLEEYADGEDGDEDLAAFGGADEALKKLDNARKANAGKPTLST